MDVVDKRGADRREAEQGHAGDQAPAAADLVAQESAAGGSDSDTGQTERGDRGELSLRHAPCFDQRRDRNTQDLIGETIDSEGNG